MLSKGVILLFLSQAGLLTTNLFLDDALLTFDDHHLAITMELLTELSKQRQVILFTCQHREFALLENARDLTTLKLPGF